MRKNRVKLISFGGRKYFKTPKLDISVRLALDSDFTAIVSTSIYFMQEFKNSDLLKMVT